MISPWPMAFIEQQCISNGRHARWATQRHTCTTLLPRREDIISKSKVNEQVNVMG